MTATKVQQPLERLLEAFQGNAYPAMLEDLGSHLGVTADSLRRLALGWCPIVTFKKGPNFSGWWAIPERDADGVPIGLSLRSQHDMKVMYPGSKHGLIYEVNPQHERGGEGYAAGASNWIRTMDAGVPCPVCLKPDGCLLSSENPSDPKAVICIREKAGAERPMKFGYLHIRKAEGHIHGSSALADHGGPVLIVEGMSDTAAALDLGFDVVGRPSNLACMDLLCNLVRGREVIIIGENDLKADGKHPGREGMVAAWQSIKRASKATMLMPPTHVKDLRAWVAKYKLNRDQFLEYHDEHAERELPGSTLPNNEPGTVAAAFIREHHTLDRNRTLVRWAGKHFMYNAGRYDDLEDESLIAQLQKWSSDKSYIEPTPKGDAVKRLVAKASTLRDWQQALLAETLLPKSVNPPAWINGAEGPLPKDLVVFQNCILDVSGFAAGRDAKRLEPTPNLFALSAMPYAYDPTAACPLWDKFLTEALSDDPDKIKLLQEWFGYCMTPDTSHQTFAYLYGNSGSGKGTTARVLRSVVGDRNCAGTTMGALAGRFGMEPLIGKLLCILPDARLSAKADAMSGLEKLLNITGEDATNVDRKGLMEVTVDALSARIMFVSNELISLPDREHATARRIRILHFAQDFTANPDIGLKDRLREETPGIARWALDGLRRLRGQGHFTEPVSSTAASREWAIRTSPASEFLDEACLLAANAEIFEDELYDAAIKWNERRDDWCRSKRQLVRSLRLACPALRFTKLPNGRGVYRGVTLTPDAARRLIGRPSGDSRPTR